MKTCFVLMKERHHRPVFGPVSKAEAVRVFLNKKEAKEAALMLNLKARDYWYSIKTLPFSV
jgi:hypothetical protein